MHLRGVWVFKHVGSMHVFVWTLFVKPVMGSMTLFIFVFISVHELWLQLQALVSQGRRREGSSRKGGGVLFACPQQVRGHLHVMDDG